MKSYEDHDDILHEDAPPAARPGRRGRHHDTPSQFLCENCGYVGTAERIEDCPNCGYRMLALEEFGSFEEDDGVLGRFDEAEDEARKAPGNPASLEDIKEDEFDEDDKFDDEHN